MLQQIKHEITVNVLAPYGSGDDRMERLDRSLT